MKYLIALIPILLVLGCVSNLVGGNTNNSVINGVKAGDTVSVDYTGRLVNGSVFDTSIGRVPLEFTVGAGQMISGFDAAVIGMRVGEEKTITLPPEEAYGAPNPANIVAVPAANIPNGTKVGDTLYSGGTAVKVVAVTNETVTIDANHPLAGKTLIFDIKIVKINGK